MKAVLPGEIVLVFRVAVSFACSSVLPRHGIFPRKEPEVAGSDEDSDAPLTLQGFMDLSMTTTNMAARFPDSEQCGG